MNISSGMTAAFVPVFPSLSSSFFKRNLRCPTESSQNLLHRGRYRRDSNISHVPVRSCTSNINLTGDPASIPEEQDNERYPLNQSPDTAVNEYGDHDQNGEQVLTDINQDILTNNLNAQREEGSLVSQGEIPPHCATIEHCIHSDTLQEYREQREAGFLPPALDSLNSEWSDAWALAITERKAQELMNQYSRVGILIELNFSDFEPALGCEQAFNNASIEDIASAKAKAVYEATGLPAIGEMHDLSIDAPESGSRINKTLQQGYYTRSVAEEGDAIIDRVRPISDENRVTTFRSAVTYFDGEMEIRTSRDVNVAIVYSGSHYVTIATAAALDDVYKELTRRLGLTLENPRKPRVGQEGEDDGDQGQVLVGATLLKERILRDGKMLGDSIIKVSSFLNHMVDTELMEVCGQELAERLRLTGPNKVLTVESTGLIAGLPTARKLGIPLVFARKSRPITISDSYQTTYRSSTKGTTNELIVSCEYLVEGDRVIIIDDFLAGGSTAEALFKLAKMAHAKVVGVGVLIEKMSDGGRAFLSGYDVPVESLAKLLPDGGEGRITFVEEEPWTSPATKLNKRRVHEKASNAEAEYYSRTGDRSDLAAASRVSSSSISSDEDDDGDDGEVNVIRWEDEDEDVLDAMEDELIRDGQKL